MSFLVYTLGALVTFTLALIFYLFHLLHFTTKGVSALVTLVLIFLFTSFIMLVVDQYFLGLSYIIVYCGAIAILIMFLLMMVDIEQQSSTISYKGSLGITALFTLLVGGTLLYYLYSIDLSHSYHHYLYFLPDYTTLPFTGYLGQSMQLKLWAVQLYMAHPLPFITVALILWVVQVGVIKLVKP